MENNYLVIPQSINSKDISKEYSFSPSNYIKLDIPNNNTFFLRDLLKLPIMGGKEVGSRQYIKKSNKYFIRTKALLPNLFILDYGSEGIVPVRPQAFINKNLREGDIIISKDSNIGEAAILDKDLSDYMLSGGLRILRLKEEKNKYYVFAFIKSQFFKQQLELLISRGATIKHAKSLWLDTKIPFPHQNNKDEVIEFFRLLVRAVVRKEVELRTKYSAIMNSIEEELIKKQKSNKFSYDLPKIYDLERDTRIDAGIFCKEYKEKQFLIENYTLGSEDIFTHGFDFKRGQNLQVSQIGLSIYTNEYKPNFYKLIRPLNLSDFGTVGDYEYLGSSRKLQPINKGEIVLSAEGTIGKFCVFLDVDKKTITNIHGITIYRKGKADEVESIFLGLFLGYLRKANVLDYISVGGQGGSLAQKYWNYIKIPNFPREKKEFLASYYFNPIKNKEHSFKLSNLDTRDEEITRKSGIVQLDTQVKAIKEKLNESMKKIIRNERVQIDFSFYSKLFS